MRYYAPAYDFVDQYQGTTIFDNLFCQLTSLWFTVNQHFVIVFSYCLYMYTTFCCITKLHTTTIVVIVQIMELGSYHASSFTKRFHCFQFSICPQAA